MTDVVLVGQPGSGKTTLLAQLARVLGRAVAGRGGTAAVPAAVGVLPPAYLTVRRGKANAVMCMHDTPGLGDDVDPDPTRRQLQAAAIENMLAGAAVLHMVDAARVGREGNAVLCGVDRDLAVWGGQRGRYVLVAAKMDLPWALSGLQSLRRELPMRVLLPVSVETGQGLGQVKAFLAKLL